MIGDSGTHINIYDTASLGLVLRIYLQNTVIKKLYWAPNNEELLVITGDSKIKIFGVAKVDDLYEAYLLR